MKNLILIGLILTIISCVYINNSDDKTIIGTWENKSKGLIYFDSDGFCMSHGLEINFANMSFTEQGNNIFLGSVKLKGPHFKRTENKLKYLILEGGEFSKISDLIEIDGFKLKKIPKPLE